MCRCSRNPKPLMIRMSGTEGDVTAAPRSEAFSSDPQPESATLFH